MQNMKSKSFFNGGGSSCYLLVEPIFFVIMRFPLTRRDSCLFLKKNHFKNGLESPLFLFYFNRENKIRKKNLKCNS